MVASCWSLGGYTRPSGSGESWFEPRRGNSKRGGCVAATALCLLSGRRPRRRRRSFLVSDEDCPVELALHVGEGRVVGVVAPAEDGGLSPIRVVLHQGLIAGRLAIELRVEGGFALG